MFITVRKYFVYILSMHLQHTTLKSHEKNIMYLSVHCHVNYVQFLF